MIGEVGAEVRPSLDSELPAIEELLAVCGLPLDGVAASFSRGLVVVEDGHVVACAAVEPYGADGLLRSVAVSPDRRRSGLGRSIVRAAEDA